MSDLPLTPGDSPAPAALNPAAPTDAPTPPETAAVTETAPPETGAADAAAADTPSEAPAEAPAEAAAQPPGAAKAPRESVDLDAVAAALKQHFPALFGAAPKPLKLRIQTDIQQRAPGQFSKRALGVFFHRYTTSTNYLIALTQATQRFDLDGQPAGELSEEHRTLAQQEVERRRALRREREAQFKPQARTPAAERGERQRPPRSQQNGAPRAEAPAGSAPADAPAARTDRPPRGERPPRPAPAGGEARPARPQQRTDRPGERNERGNARGESAPRGPRAERGERSDRPERGNRPDRPDRPERRGPSGPQRRDGADFRAPRPATQEAAPDTTPLPADPAERAAVEARRARATLLRDFERSPLSLANFCVLKGLTPAQLEPMLAQARQERGAR